MYENIRYPPPPPLGTGPDEHHLIRECTFTLYLGVSYKVLFCYGVVSRWAREQVALLIMFVLSGVGGGVTLIFSYIRRLGPFWGGGSKS